MRGHLAAELPFLLSEKILAAVSERGGDRQEAHERIRTHALGAIGAIEAAEKERSPEHIMRTFTERIANDKLLQVDINALIGGTDGAALIGYAEVQTRQWIAECAPLVEGVDTQAMARAAPEIRVQ